MLASALTALAWLAGLLVAWLAIQRLWRRQFPTAGDDDALAGRGGCHGCNCAPGTCDNQAHDTKDTTTEVNRHAP